MSRQTMSRAELASALAHINETWGTFFTLEEAETLIADFDDRRRKDGRGLVRLPLYETLENREFQFKGREWQAGEQIVSLELAHRRREIAQWKEAGENWERRD